MKIETKFSIDQEVYFIENNEVKKDSIWTIDVKIGRSGKVEKDLISYVFYRTNCNFSLNENKVFTTKEELINSL